jgi:Phosphatidylethanolamine-binding protein
MVLLLALAGLAAGTSGDGQPRTERALPEPITVSSSAFTEGSAIPQRFTCDGDNRSPPLGWSGVPAGTVQLALVVDDPDAPRGSYVHWIVIGLDPASTKLTEATVPPGARHGDNHLLGLSERDMSAVSRQGRLGGCGGERVGLADVGGGSNPAEEGEGAAELLVRLGSTSGPDQELGRLQSSERRLGLGLDVVVQVSRPLELSGGDRRRSLEPSSGRLGVGKELQQLRASSERLEDDGQVA